MQKKIFFIGIMLLGFYALFGQEAKTNQQAIEDLVEEIAQGIVGETDYSQITDNLYYFLENPVNLNTAPTETLEKLRILNDFQIKSLLNYIEHRGKLATIYELQLIEGFDYATIKKVLPFVTVLPDNYTKTWSVNKAFKYGKHSMFGRVHSVIETQNGFKKVADSVLNENPSRYYPGNRMRIYTRYKFNYKNKLQWGITAEKDPGEQFLKGGQKAGFDFYSAHLQVSDIGVLKTAVLGDFQAQLGQGLIMWSYISQGKSSYVMDIRKRGQGLKKYSSTDENVYLRGGGLTVEKWGVSLTAFGSYKNRDANISIGDSLSNSEKISSLLNSGIHALPAEIEDKNSITETIYGGNLNWRHKNFKIGVSGINYRFNIPFKINNTPENRYRFSGKNNYNISADAEYRFKAIYVFGEAAMSQNGNKAVLAGALMELSPQFRTAILYRNYQKGYQALYSNAFAESSRIQNEQGFYLGAEMHPVKKWKISAYYDFYKFPWIKSQADSPSKGNDYLIQADFTASQTLNMYCRYKHEEKEVNISIEQAGIPPLGIVDKVQFRYHVNYRPGKNWKLRNRLELSSYKQENNEKEYGYMLYQDIIYRPDYPISIIFRYAVFDTKGYNTRIYTYENEVLNAYSVPPLFDKGIRTYIIAHYRLSEKIDFWLRLAQTWYADKKTIGTGLNQISGNTKSEVKFQLRLKF